MRIISQDRTRDISYEQVCIDTSTRSLKIIAWHPLDNEENYILLAEYSSQEKLDKAMEMLHEEYIYLEHCRILNTYMKLPTLCFQFPQDDEIEV